MTFQKLLISSTGEE